MPSRAAAAKRTASTSGNGTPSTASGGAGGTDGGDGEELGPEPTLPTAVEPCPTLVTGTTEFRGTQVDLYVGERREDVQGPVLFYWHGTGSVAAEVRIFMQAQIDDVVARGGLVASFSTSTGVGIMTGPGVWYESDYDMADQILACAVEQLNIDPRRIFSAGCSAGGLQTSKMLYYRSGYLAAGIPNSGGTAEPFPDMQDPSHVPALMTTHGAEGVDVVGIDFSIFSATLDADIAARGGFVVDCNHGGGHCGGPQEVIVAQWQFANDHPFGFQTSPYESGLPDTFPAYCEIIR